MKPGGSQDPYPWLDPEDPRCKLTDEQILEHTVDLSMSCLTNREKCSLMRMIKRYKRAFSLRDEIGECPNIQLNIDVIDDSPFFVRPFPIAEKDKPIMDRQMNRLVSLGILSPQQYQPYITRLAYHSQSDTRQASCCGFLPAEYSYQMVEYCKPANA